VDADVVVIAGAVLLGLCIGSFLNVCILRLPRDQSLVRPRSTCPNCKQPIAWRDNILLVALAARQVPLVPHAHLQSVPAH